MRPRKGLRRRKATGKAMGMVGKGLDSPEWAGKGKGRGREHTLFKQWRCKFKIFTSGHLTFNLDLESAITGSTAVTE